jgi:hypothetical protein
VSALGQLPSRLAPGQPATDNVNLAHAVALSPETRDQ